MEKSGRYALFRMKNNRFMKQKIFACILLMMGVCVAVQAQMSDSQVTAYIKAATKAGKKEAQIGQELMLRGVTQAQMERLKKRYESSQGVEGVLTDDAETMSGQNRGRGDAALSQAISTMNFDNMIQSMADAEDTVFPIEKRNVFGRNVFNNPRLTFEPNENSATPENYRLGPGDEIIIDIWGENEASLRQEISPEGNIMVSQVGPVYLNGLTIQQANDKIKGVFARKYSGVSGDNPDSQIRVTLGQIRTIQVNIMGEVQVPGTYRLSSFSTLFHALYRAGGVTDIGTLRNVQVVRDGKPLASIDLYKYLFEGKLSDDIRLQEGDVVIVPPYEVMVSIAGNVKRPLYYEMKEGETLSALIDYAGGFTGNAYSKEVRVVRKSDRENQLFNVGSDKYASYQLEDGDSILVGAILDRFANRVEVRGAVYRPGMYELGDEMQTVKQLVARAEGLKGDAFLNRVLLYREREDLTTEVLAVDLKGIINGIQPDIPLQRNDILEIASILDLEDKGAFTITGEVVNPGLYPYADNTTLEDIIIQAGGLLDGASTVKVDVSRRLRDAKATMTTDSLSRLYTFALKDGFVIEGDSNFYLEPYDVIMVYRSPVYQRQRHVFIKGEVLFPGDYTLAKKNERLSDLITRSGGFTSEAYLRGAYLRRQMNDDERILREQVLRLSQAGLGDTIATSRLQLSDTYTVGIELDKALKKKGSDYDLVLREGDELVIPEYETTVKIEGQVLFPNTVSYLKGKKVKYYITQAGGFASRAKKHKVYIVYMNGTVAKAKNRKSIIEPGCRIVVPAKRQRNGLSVGEIIGLTTSAASVGTMAASIANMAK